MKLFSIIIPYIHRSPFSAKMLKKLTALFSGFQGSQIIVVEAGSKSHLGELNIFGELLFLKTEAPKNLAWMFNHATKLADSNVLVFFDEMVFMHPADIAWALNQLNSCDGVFPLGTTRLLDFQESEQPFEILLSTGVDNGPLEFGKQGAFITKTAAVSLVGGFNEELFIEKNMFDDMYKKYEIFGLPVQTSDKYAKKFAGGNNAPPDEKLLKRDEKQLSMLNPPLIKASAERNWSLAGHRQRFSR